MKIHYLVFVIFFLILSFNNTANGIKLIGFEDNNTIYNVIDDDLYIIRGDILINGTVRGDVVILSGHVEILGNVSGDVWVGSGDVIIKGNVGDDVRVGTGTLKLDGKIGDDLLVGAGNIFISNNSFIGGDLVYGSNNIELGGDVGGNVYGMSDSATIIGHIQGETNLEVENLSVLPSARIDGNLSYSSPKESIIAPGIVGKNINFNKKDLTKKEKNIVISIIWWFIKFSFLLIIGLIIFFILPNRTTAIAEAIPENLLINLFLGLLLIIIGISLPLILFVTVMGIPLGILILIITIIFMYIGRIWFGLWLGRLILSYFGIKSKSKMDMVVGLFAVFILTSIPWIGFIIYLLVTFISIGAFFNEEKKIYLEMRERNLL